MIVKASENWVAAHGDSSPAEKAASVGPPRPRTLFEVLRNSTAPEEERTAARIAQEGIEMFMAGYTPGRTAMLGMYYLHANPHILARLRQELDRINSDPAVDLTFAKLNSSLYVVSGHNVTMRSTGLCTDFWNSAHLPKSCCASHSLSGLDSPCYVLMIFGSRAGGFLQMSVVIDPSLNDDLLTCSKTGISVNHRALLFDPDVYKEPHHFNPDRWLDESNIFDERRYYIPFGKGTRSCPSKEYAYRALLFPPTHGTDSSQICYSVHPADSRNACAEV
jgi:hypothetical protein